MATVGSTSPGLVSYVKGLVDPFSAEATNSVIRDGKENLSAGVTFRSVGSFVLDHTGPSYILLLAGSANVVQVWCPALPYDAAVPEPQTFPFPGHTSTAEGRGYQRKWRLVSAGVQLSLENAPDQNEGYWEAARFPLDEFLTDATNYCTRITSIAAFASLANFPTFQTGKLRDIHRYMFKLNSVTDDHDFASLGETPINNMVTDGAFDAIVIKLYGRRDAALPSVVRFNAVSNQEIVFREGTIMSRIQTRNTRIRDIAEILGKSSYPKPGILI
jgi:hypothetical protein